MAVKARKPLSKRLRFEILKRDGFRCRYCGATPDQRLLHVDHVVPVAEGGTNDALNLVASCQPCNSGKAAKSLDQRIAPLAPAPSSRDLAEQRAQVEAYLAAQREQEAMRDAVVEALCERWEQCIGPMSEGAMQRIRSLSADVRHDLILQAIDITGRSKVGTSGMSFDEYWALKQLKYFSAVLRNLRDGREWRRW